MDILQALYDSEINFRIETFWDAGFIAKLGDEMNGFVWESCEFPAAADAIEALAVAACKHFPDSTFAKNRSGTMIGKPEPAGAESPA